MTGRAEGGNPDQAILLARYTENCEQARHHETLRERTTSMVASTTGVMLGLLGFKEGTWTTNPTRLFIPAFVIVLGIWGLISAVLSEARIRRQRDRINEIRRLLEPDFEPEEPTKQTRWVWVAFHAGVIVVGAVLLVIIATQS